MKRIRALSVMLSIGCLTLSAWAEEEKKAQEPATASDAATEIQSLKERLSKLEGRVVQTEIKDSKDSVNFKGDARVMVNSVHGKLAAFSQLTPMGAMPASPTESFHNYKMYTMRFRLGMEAPVSDNIKFRGRLAMYKLFGDSTGVSIFNGQTNTYAFDGEMGRVPYDSSLRVERAYFDWTDIGGSPIYISLGRRPSTDGPPEQLEQNDVRQGSPNGHTINYAFDGITLGMHLEKFLPLSGSVFKICYGVGYEAGLRNGDILSNNNVFNSVAADSLRDTDFVGINWDVLEDSDSGTHIQTQHAFALNLVDLSPGLAVFPYAVDPATGIPYNNATTIQPVQRLTATKNIGNVYLGSLMLMRNEKHFDWFVSGALSRTMANGNFSDFGFGGMLCDQGSPTCPNQTGYSLWTGLQYPMESIHTKLGFEYNFGTKYWVNFTQGSDDLMGSKTATRGHVADFYTIFDIAKNAFIKLNYQYYRYTFSGSGWTLGEPKKLSGTPGLLFPTPENVHNIQVAMQVGF